MRGLRSGCAAAILILGTALLSGCTDTSQENKEAYKTIGIHAYEAGDYKEAVDAFDKALAQANGVVTMDEADICFYKARALFRDGKKKKALAVYDALLDLDSSLNEAYFLRGSVKLSMGKDEEAMEDFREAIRRDPKNIELYIAVYDNLREAGKEEEGKEFLQGATEISGSKASDHTLRGRAFMLLGNYEGARDELLNGAEKNDDEALLYLGELYSLEGDQATAKNYYSEYLALHEEDAGALNVLGCYSMENEDYEQALTYFDQALEYSGSSGIDPQEILRNRILCLEYLERFEDAELALEEYLQFYEPDEVLTREGVFLDTRV